jgi:hypothetical protein
MKRKGKLNTTLTACIRNTGVRRNCGTRSDIADDDANGVSTVPKAPVDLS